MLFDWKQVENPVGCCFPIMKVVGKNSVHLAQFENAMLKLSSYDESFAQYSECSILG